MSDLESTLREEIVEICRRLYLRGLLSAADGNVSAKLNENEFLITPSGVHKGFLKPQEIVIMDRFGNVKQGKPSSESKMHLQVFNTCPQAQAVVHAHPPTAIAWSIARPTLNELPSEGLSEVILAVGSLPIVPFAMPGSQEMGLNLLPYLPNSRVMVLARHGGLSWGESLSEAFNGMERLENSADILFRAEQLGGVTSLPSETVSQLKALRKIIGSKSL